MLPPPEILPKCYHQMIEHMSRGKRTRRFHLEMSTCAWRKKDKTIAIEDGKRYRLMAKLSRLPSIELMLPEKSPTG